MNELLVMRHAKSDWTIGTSDFERPLNARGDRAADAMAAWILDEQICPDVIISSPAARTRATATAVAVACGGDPADIEFDHDLYLAGSFAWMQVLTRQTAARVLICGHNPGLDDLVESLAGGLVPLSRSGKLMSTAAVAHFRVPSDWSSLDAGGGELVQIVRPDDLS